MQCIVKGDTCGDGTDNTVHDDQTKGEGEMRDKKKNKVVLYLEEDLNQKLIDIKCFINGRNRNDAIRHLINEVYEEVDDDKQQTGDS